MSDEPGFGKETLGTVEGVSAPEQTTDPDIQVVRRGLHYTESASVRAAIPALKRIEARLARLTRAASAHCFCRGDYSPAFEQSWVACCRCDVTTYDTLGKELLGPTQWIPGGRYGLPALADEQEKGKPLPDCSGAWDALAAELDQEATT